MKDGIEETTKAGLDAAKFMVNSASRRDLASRLTSGCFGQFLQLKLYD